LKKKIKLADQFCLPAYYFPCTYASISPGTVSCLILIQCFLFSHFLLVRASVYATLDYTSNLSEVDWDTQQDLPCRPYVSHLNLVLANAVRSKHFILRFSRRVQIPGAVLNVIMFCFDFFS